MEIIPVENNVSFEFSYLQFVKFEVDQGIIAFGTVLWVKKERLKIDLTAHAAILDKVAPFPKCPYEAQI